MIYDIEWQIAHYNSVLGNLDKEDSIHCEKCLNRGFIYVKNGDYISVKNCECLNKRKIAKAIKTSGLGTRFLENSFDNFMAKEQWEVTMKNTTINFLDQVDKWLVLSGQVGSGKTHLAVAVCKVFIELGRNVMYLNYAKNYKSLRKRLLSGFPDVQKIAQKEQEEIFNVDVLFIDDFLKLSDDMEEVFDLIDFRYANNLVTIITTEYDYQTMYSKSEAVATRIKEMASNYWLHINKDARKNKRVKE